jgi:hypothetical protein
MLGRSYVQDAYAENNELPSRSDRMHKPFEVHVYGEVIVREFETHVRISKNDWDKYKQRLIPVLKQGDRKDGSTDTEASEVGIKSGSARS